MAVYKNEERIRTFHEMHQVEWQISLIKIHFCHEGCASKKDFRLEDSLGQGLHKKNGQIFCG